jgi:hypothetical protein
MLAGVLYELYFFWENLRFSRFPVGLLPFGITKVRGLFGQASTRLRNKLSEGCKWLRVGLKFL